jgi:RNA polymerase sigma-70 factor (ECF subfamily)
MTQAECKEVFALLSQYMDGELPADLCSKFDRHIEDCPPCVEFLESLKKASRLCKQGEVLREDPGALPERTRQEILDAYRRFKSTLP